MLTEFVYVAKWLNVSVDFCCCLLSTLLFGKEIKLPVGQNLFLWAESLSQNVSLNGGCLHTDQTGALLSRNKGDNQNLKSESKKQTQMSKNEPLIFPERNQTEKKNLKLQY